MRDPKLNKTGAFERSSTSQEEEDTDLKKGRTGELQEETVSGEKAVTVEREVFRDLVNRIEQDSWSKLLTKGGAVHDGNLEREKNLVMTEASIGLEVTLMQDEEANDAG